jgi:hypothetical protein
MHNKPLCGIEKLLFPPLKMMYITTFDHYILNMSSIVINCIRLFKLNVCTYYLLLQLNISITIHSQSLQSLMLNLSKTSFDDRREYYCAWWGNTASNPFKYTNLRAPAPLFFPKQSWLIIRVPIKIVRACLVPNFSPQLHYAKRRFPITSKCRQMHGVLNIDEIKN